ncbi:galactosyl transferase GMA12/MNN10 family-domain-containing protein [Pyronema domesticum]|uniref:Similar to Probable alpha-1,6-mannosyltransferase MNN10 acc. no. P50108 n=1 Tax=Pyronema omphalodes (strain CBS 100304) TaxID=1076935 RepID=U4LTP9_PYROM|nr:galactosyl transferase GMA12/MNN10 family-domain-containing protein [Pyronema domesticum]CCX33010.1 Similar to Probable alpha-1,6-mannosyltransferase MNN10; acc. no. P50108 [Pyronema omphalodes CBS 100304]
MSGNTFWAPEGGGSRPESTSPSPLPISRANSPARISRNDATASPTGWAAPRYSTTASANGYAPSNTRKFIGKHLRKISTSLPTYNRSAGWTPAQNSRFGGIFHRIKTILFRKTRATIVFWALLSFCAFVGLYVHQNPASTWVKSASGGSKFVIILAANQGGGVMTWKGAKEWAVERDSIANKKAYAEKWGYHLEIKDMSTKKRYAHEWRESWEKVDVIKQTMRQYPKAEWFWWLDLHTFIMEPSISLQSHIFNHLQNVTYRDINVYNPLNITHPPSPSDFYYLDETSKSAVGDDKAGSINIIVPQDCGGFNLGSFFVRRSDFTERLLDIWWDPVGYEQKHMEWEHKEQDALEYLYTNQPWIRSGTAFIPQRMINSFPPGACSETPDDPRIFYQEADRDFVVNMAGCEWGRDCWGEMASYRKVSERLNKSWWSRWRK